VIYFSLKIAIRNFGERMIGPVRIPPEAARKKSEVNRMRGPLFGRRDE
jgi:hypothetical protein